jgi:cob(I)alamin adenosyltransferase
VRCVTRPVGQSTETEMKIYTKTGDAGETGLFGGPRVRKDHARIEAFGTVDELNSQLGVVRSLPLPDGVDALLRRVQCELFEMGAQLATPNPAQDRIGTAHVEVLEGEIDQFESQLAPLACFILPAGTATAAAVHVARTVCRRAERRVVSLAAEPGTVIPAAAIEYLNRLGDLLFVLARHINASASTPDDPWHPAS